MSEGHVRLLRALVAFLGTPSGLDKQHRVLSYVMGYIVGPKLAGRPGEVLRSLGGAITMARYVNRFGDLWYYLLALSTPSAQRDGLTRLVLRLQDLALLVYQKTEIVSWVGYTAPTARLVDADWWMRQSCWAWVAWIVLDVLRVLRGVQQRAAQRRKEASPVLQEPLLQRADVVALGDAACNLPMALTWASGWPRLTQPQLGLLGMVSTVLLSWARWQQCWRDAGQ